MNSADVGLIGLAVMVRPISLPLRGHTNVQGQNLILNMNDKGFKVCAYNRYVY
jgi:6-phosphogluconate dehydrogenase